MSRDAALVIHMSADVAAAAASLDVAKANLDALVAETQDCRG